MLIICCILLDFFYEVFYDVRIHELQVYILLLQGVPEDGTSLSKYLGVNV
jgi:hypothetical protein